MAIISRTRILKQLLDEITAGNVESEEITAFFNGEVRPKNTVFSLTEPGKHELRISWQA